MILIVTHGVNCMHRPVSGQVKRGGVVFESVDYSGCSVFVCLDFVFSIMQSGGFGKLTT